MEVLALTSAGVDLFNLTPEQEKSMNDAATQWFTTMNQKVGKEGVVRILLVWAFSQSISDKNTITGIVVPDVENQEYSNADIKKDLIDTYFKILNSDQYKGTFQKVVNESVAWSNFCNMCKPTQNGGLGPILSIIGGAAAVALALITGEPMLLPAGLVAGVGGGALLQDVAEVHLQMQAIKAEQPPISPQVKEEKMREFFQEMKAKKADRKAKKADRKAEKAKLLLKENNAPPTGAYRKTNRKTLRRRKAYKQI